MEINAQRFGTPRIGEFIHYAKDYYQMPQAHFHDGYEIGLVLTNADVIFYVEDKSYSVTNGTLFILNENEMHRFDIPHGTLGERYNIHFPPHFIHSMIADYPEFTEFFTDRPEGFEHCVLLDDFQKQGMIQLFDKMLHCQKDMDSPNYQLRIKVILLEILLAVNDIYYKNNKTLVISNNKYKTHLYNIMDFIKNHLSDDIRLDTLANNFFMSKSYINKIFNQTLKMTPHQYIIHCRILKSREYLKQGMTVNQVCEHIGYDDISNFIRTFKKLIGCTPKQYALANDTNLK